MRIVHRQKTLRKNKRGINNTMKSHIRKKNGQLKKTTRKKRNKTKKRRMKKVHGGEGETTEKLTKEEEDAIVRAAQEKYINITDEHKQNIRYNILKVLRGESLYNKEDVKSIIIKNKKEREKEKEEKKETEERERRELAEKEERERRELDDYAPIGITAPRDNAENLDSKIKAIESDIRVYNEKLKELEGIKTPPKKEARTKKPSSKNKKSPYITNRQAGGLHAMDQGNFGHCTAYAFARVIYKLFKHKDIRLVSDPSNTLYSDSIKSEYKPDSFDNLKEKFNAFTAARKKEKVGNDPESSISSPDVVEAIYNEQANCFYAILPILVYYFHVLSPVVTYFRVKFPGVFPSFLLDDKIISELFFTEENIKIIVQDDEFEKFSFNSVELKTGITPAYLFEKQLKTYKNYMIQLQHKFKEAFLIPIELTVKPNETRNYSDVSVLPHSQEEPTKYMYIIAGGQYKQKIFNRDTLLTNHAAIVSDVNKKSITVKNSYNEGWEDNGSRTVSISDIKDLPYKNDVLEFNVILLLPTKLPFQIAQKKLDDFIFLQTQKLGDDEKDKNIIVYELNGIIDEIWQKAVNIVNYRFPSDDGNKTPDDRESDSPSQQDKSNASNKEVDYRVAQEKLNTFLLDLINNKSEKNEALIRDEFDQKIDIIRKKANELFLESS